MSTVRAGLISFAAIDLALALSMAVSPHAFYTAVGPFGAYNAHYIRDVASYNAALGIGFVIAYRQASWRVPVLVMSAVQFALHSVNHLIDIGKEHPAWTGYFDFFSLASATVLLVWLSRAALAERALVFHPTLEGDSP
jgi:hypothetical protein